MSAPGTTPGPWRVDGLKPQDGWGNREGEDRCEIAILPHPAFDAVEIYGRRVRDDYEEHEANAHLIAAAPALYDACEKALNYIENTEGELGIQLECGDALREALALARGEHGEVG